MRPQEKKSFKNNNQANEEEGEKNPILQNLQKDRNQYRVFNNSSEN